MEASSTTTLPSTHNSFSSSQAPQKQFNSSTPHKLTKTRQQPITGEAVFSILTKIQSTAESSTSGGGRTLLDPLQLKSSSLHLLLSHPFETTLTSWSINWISEVRVNRRPWMMREFQYMLCHIWLRSEFGESFQSSCNYYLVQALQCSGATQ